MNKFVPFYNYVEVEPIKSSGALVSDENNKWEEKAMVIKTRNWWQRFRWGIKENCIIFFRRHGFFELVEYDGTIHYVVRVDPEFILGIIKHERKD
jgi:hypothetical protein